MAQDGTIKSLQEKADLYDQIAPMLVALPAAIRHVLDRFTEEMGVQSYEAELKAKADKLDEIEALIQKLEADGTLHTAMDDTLEMLDGVMDIMRPGWAEKLLLPERELPQRESIVFHLTDPKARATLITTAMEAGLPVTQDGEVVAILATPAEAFALGWGPVKPVKPE